MLVRTSPFERGGDHEGPVGSASFDDALLARKPGNRTAFHLLVLREKHGCSLADAADRLAAAYGRRPDSPAATRIDPH
ncbi:hypothetical protein [Nocardia aurea]|uniref:Uncharacterized protein n=1 Tax=Nocardia aurea TaxID=2144174 RepID=A0ABV3FT13_9NOCA